MAKADPCDSRLEVVQEPDADRGNLRTFEINGQRVMLDADVARVLGSETRRVNWAVARNLEMFTSSHSFRLDPGPDTARQPRVFTLKGIIRLATILRTPEALRATDLVIDTFAAARQLDTGSAASPTSPSAPASSALRTKLASAVEGLLSTLVSTTENADLRTAAKELGGTAFAHVVERLRSRGLENGKLEADTDYVLAQAQKVLADARQTDAETRRIDLEALERKIAIVEKLVEISRKLEPVSFVDMLGTFKAKPAQAPGRRPSRRRKRRS